MHLDEKEEILSIARGRNGAGRHDLNLGKLFIPDLERLVRLVAILQHDLEAVVAGPARETLDLGFRGQEWGR